MLRGIQSLLFFLLCSFKIVVKRVEVNTDLISKYICLEDDHSELRKVYDDMHLNALDTNTPKYFV